MWVRCCVRKTKGHPTKFIFEFTTFDAYIVDLAGCAFFFAMRSCEYLTVPSRGKTKLLTIGNIVFTTKDKHVTIRADHPRFNELAAYVSVTFIDQKNNKKAETRTQSRTSDPVFDPVLMWGRVIWRILHFRPNAPPDTPVNCWFDPTKPSKPPRFIRQEDLRNLLRETCALGGGYTKFGYHPMDIGTHSIRSGAAMSLFLADCSVAKIMILGRWSSSAFMRYIRPQVLEWTSGMAQLMLTTQDFRHLDSSTVASRTESLERLRNRLDNLIDPAFQTNTETAMESPEENLFIGPGPLIHFPNTLHLDL